MQKKIKYLIGFLGKKNLIAICALVVLVAAISVGIIISNNNAKKEENANAEVEESTGLQVEENADDVEGDSVDFSEFEEAADNQNDSSTKQEGTDKTGSDTTQSNKTEDNKTEDNKTEDNKTEDNKTEDNKNSDESYGAFF